MKKIIFIFLLTVFYFNYTQACKYSSEIQQCNNEVSNFMFNNSFIKPWSSIKSFDDFICLQDWPEKRALQIAMDLNFREIDDEMDLYLDNLTKNKNLYFWPEAEYNYFDWINDIWDMSNYFRSKYYNACSLSLEETFQCIKNFSYTLEEEQKSVSIDNAKDFLSWSTWDCYKLADIKISIFNSVSYNVLLLNQQQVARDQKKLYEQQTRSRYSRIIDLMMINLWYIERIWMKWPSKIKNPL